jgi:hypothetical protein
MIFSRGSGCKRRVDAEARGEVLLANLANPVANYLSRITAQEPGTVADLLTDIKRDIDRRLDELRPVRDEFRRLERARDALATAHDSRPTVGARRAIADSGRTRMSRAQSQELDRRVLALLREDSTQKPAALAMLAETSVGSMNARLNRLVRDGELKKRKRGRTIRYQVP